MNLLGDVQHQDVFLLVPFPVDVLNVDILFLELECLFETILGRLQDDVNELRLLGELLWNFDGPDFVVVKVSSLLVDLDLVFIFRFYLFHYLWLGLLVELLSLDIIQVVDQRIEVVG